MGLFPIIVTSDAVGGAATGRSGQLAVGGSAEGHMIVRGSGTECVEKRFSILSRCLMPPHVTCVGGASIAHARHLHDG